MNLPPTTGPAAPSASKVDASKPAAPSPQLKKAASEFEGMLISTLWKGLLDDPMGGLDGDADPASGSIQSLGLQAMSTAISSSGGLGLAKMVERQLSPHAPDASAGPPAALFEHNAPLKLSRQPADMPLESSQPELYSLSGQWPAGNSSLKPAAKTGGGA